MNYEIVEAGDEPKNRYKVHTTKYIYRLMDCDKDPIADYHWHPDDTPNIPYPHLHATEYGCKRHHPTGRVLIEDLLTLAVECGAAPVDEAKWKRVVTRNRANFALGATWGTPAY